jgi:hypothetical protein
MFYFDMQAFRRLSIHLFHLSHPSLQRQAPESELSPTQWSDDCRYDPNRNVSLWHLILRRGYGNPFAAERRA